MKWGSLSNLADSGSNFFSKKTQLPDVIQGIRLPFTLVFQFPVLLIVL